jgi:hypothetical protein
MMSMGGTERAIEENHGSLNQWGEGGDRFCEFVLWIESGKDASHECYGRYYACQKERPIEVSWTILLELLFCEESVHVIHEVEYTTLKSLVRCPNKTEAFGGKTINV